MTLLLTLTWTIAGIATHRALRGAWGDWRFRRYMAQFGGREGKRGRHLSMTTPGSHRWVTSRARPEQDHST